MKHAIWRQKFIGNTGLEWGQALLSLAICFVVIFLIRFFIRRTIRRWKGKHNHELNAHFLQALDGSGIPLLLIASTYFAVSLLDFTKKTERIIHIAFLFAATFFAVRMIRAIIRQLVFSFIKNQENLAEKKRQANGLLFILNVIVWILAATFLIGNLGYNVTTLVAGLGIGGIALALAAQTILGDLFNYFVIFFDKPFEVGDFIIVEDKLGTIEYIGLKTTRVRSLSGEQLVFSNTDLTSARVHNYKRMEQRRVVFQLKIVFQTPKEQLVHIPEIVKNIITTHENVRFDRGHFSEIGDFYYGFEFVYYVLDPDFAVYRDIQQDILLRILEAFRKENIFLAYPAQNLFLKEGIQKSTFS